MATLAELEQRLAALEAEVSRLKAAGGERPAKNWVQAVSGRFEGDPDFEEIARLGREFRASQTDDGEA